mmetsp:Transcript_14885/g.37707  ORF Transcript_14885/g.37707 Transcript_14885/m.37707 type:complete len:101 (+) Transcript_14885:996-1298(+)
MRVCSTMMALAAAECSSTAAVSLSAEIGNSCSYTDCNGATEYYDCVFGKIDGSACTENANAQVTAFAEGARGYKETCEASHAGRSAGVGLAVLLGAVALK